MAKKTAYSAGESSRRITRKLTFANLAVMTVLLALSLVALNVVTTVATYHRIDSEQVRQLIGFAKSHFSAEEHSERLPAGLLPNIFFLDNDEGYINPHPTDTASPADAEALLASTIPPGESNVTIDGRTFRIHRVVYDDPLVFWEQGHSYQAAETVSITDITSEAANLELLRWVSLACFAVSALVFGIFAYWQARKTIVPINEAWGKQRQFTADTSHELRNPLAVVQANAELLLKNPDATIRDQGAQVAAILDGSGRMSSMLSTLLTLARADADQIEILDERVALSDLLQRDFELFEPIGALRDIAITAALEPGAFVRGDGSRLHELFSVLIDNAIRYTEPGGSVTIACAVRAQEVEVGIVDGGIGMSEKDLASVFERFYRGEGAQTVNPEGTGLGLPIAKWIAERHDATFKIESVRGKGTRVTLAFKRAG